MLKFLAFAILASVLVGYASAQTVTCASTAGKFSIRLDRHLSPQGVNRVIGMVKTGYFDDMPLYGVMPNFAIFFGVGATRNMTMHWCLKALAFDDEPKMAPFRKGTLTFSGEEGVANDRTCHLFFALSDNDGAFHNEKRKYAIPIGQVLEEDMDVLDNIVERYGKTGYGQDGIQSQGLLAAEGNKAMLKKFPKLDKLIKCTFMAREKLVKQLGKYAIHVNGTADGTVQKGAIGKVLGNQGVPYNKGGPVKVHFQNGTWGFQVESLRPATEDEIQENKMLLESMVDTKRLKRRSNLLKDDL